MGLLMAWGAVDMKSRRVLDLGYMSDVLKEMSGENDLILFLIWIRFETMESILGILLENIIELGD